MFVCWLDMCEALPGDAVVIFESVIDDPSTRIRSIRHEVTQIASIKSEHLELTDKIGRALGVHGVFDGLPASLRASSCLSMESSRPGVFVKKFEFRPVRAGVFAIRPIWLSVGGARLVMNSVCLTVHPPPSNRIGEAYPYPDDEESDPSLVHREQYEL